MLLVNRFYSHALTQSTVNIPSAENCALLGYYVADGGNSETWVLSEVDALRLGVFEKKILRRIYRPICEEVTWTSRYNEKLYLSYDEADLITTVKRARLRWAGHIVRMQDNLPCKKVTLDKPEGRRRSGRPDLRWMNGMMKDVEKLGVRNWRTMARDRDGWRCLLESAKTLRVSEWMVLIS
jgi:hypothetical protein